MNKLKQILNSNEDLETKKTMLDIYQFEKNLNLIVSNIDNNNRNNEIIDNFNNEIINLINNDIVIYNYDDLYNNVVNYHITNLDCNVGEFIENMVLNDKFIIYGNENNLKECYFIYKQCLKDILFNISVEFGL